MSLSQPCNHRYYGFSFLDRNSILFPYRVNGQEQMLRFQVATFESLNTTDEATLRFYHFKLDALGPQPEHAYCLNMNTLPSNTSGSRFPGFFHPEPSSRLLALEVETPITDCTGGSIPLRVLYVPHDVLLRYIMCHPSDTETVMVPWEAWGPGNAHIWSLPDPSPDRFLGSKIVCGMHAVTEPPMVIVQGDQKILRIMDYHPRRVVHNTVIQDAHLRGAANSNEGSRPSGITAAWQEVGVSTEKLPYVPKDIPLPCQLRGDNIKCVLGEDVVVVFEVGTLRLSTMRYKGTHTVQVLYRYIRRFWSQDREGVLSSNLVAPAWSAAGRCDARPRLEAMSQLNPRHDDAHAV